MSNETRIILRHSEPNLLDESSYGTACKVIRDKDYDLYVQIQKNEDEKPNWLFIGTFTDDSLIQEEIENILGK